MASTLTKSEILADEGKFQEACRAWVNQNIGCCVSSLMYDLGRNLEECSRIFDFDYSDALSWFQRDDWVEPVNDYIDNADLEELETVAEMVGYWDDVLAESGVPKVEEITFPAENNESEEDEDGYRFFDVKGTPWIFDDEDDAIEAARNSVIDTIRTKVKECFTSDDEYREVAEDLGLDPNSWEVYEHWIIPKGYIASTLREHGELTFDFGGMTIWGRTTTGQAICIDYVIREIVRDLDEDHWVWRDVR